MNHEHQLEVDQSHVKLFPAGNDDSHLASGWIVVGCAYCNYQQIFMLVRAEQQDGKIGVRIPILETPCCEGKVT